jgi:hypothetical protein
MATRYTADGARVTMTPEQIDEMQLQAIRGTAEPHKNPRDGFVNGCNYLEVPQEIRAFPRKPRYYKRITLFGRTFVAPKDGVVRVTYYKRFMKASARTEVKIMSALRATVVDVLDAVVSQSFHKSRERVGIPTVFGHNEI